jgi:hypothetical protein
MDMSSASFPCVLTAPIVPRAIPCFRLGSLESPKRRNGAQAWNEHCTEILLTAESRSNAEVADLIEAKTGMRFSPSVISRHRRAAGLTRPRHNEWTSALRRWKPWQGHLATKS